MLYTSLLQGRSLGLIFATWECVTADFFWHKNIGKIKENFSSLLEHKTQCQVCFYKRKTDLIQQNDQYRKSKKSDQKMFARARTRACARARACVCVCVS